MATTAIQKINGSITDTTFATDITKSKIKMYLPYRTIDMGNAIRKKDRKNRPYIGIGLVGGVKLASKTKVKNKSKGSEFKRVERDDYFLAPLRYGYTIRMGYQALNLYAIYYPVGLFEKNKGPELYPVAFGLSLVI
ncbi:MAG: hypothetical protein HC896_18130 [Bacteroidales bacterium]|nr:hypothetical protein [Bacteroidales bacterium]